MEPTTDTPRAERILEAADELLAEKGYDGISMSKVAAQAGVNKALVFYYYKNKEGLFARVLERYYEAHRRALAEAFEREGSLRERIHGMIDAYLAFAGENARYPRMVQNLMARGDEGQLRVIREQMRPLFAWTVEALREVVPESGPLAARQFYSDFSGLVINYFNYAPALTGVWGGDPLSAEALEERRKHLHWIVDALFAALEREQD